MRLTLPGRVTVALSSPERMGEAVLGDFGP